MGDLTPPGSGKCRSCGKNELKLLTGRVSKLEKEGGYANVFHCAGCGEIEMRDIPYDPSTRQT